jgi:hypothetical protein
MSWFDKPYKGASFDSEILTLIKAAFEAGWHELCSTNAPIAAVRAGTLRNRLAQTILHLAENGERNPNVLKTRAIMSLRATEHLN